MADIHTLKPVGKFEPNLQTIELLERLLEDAKAGTIESFWGVTFEPDDESYEVVASANFGTLRKIGMIEAIKATLLDASRT